MEVVYAHEYDSSTLTYRYYFDNFFDATAQAKTCCSAKPKPDDVNLFDYAAGRTLFDLADLD